MSEHRIVQHDMPQVVFQQNHDTKLILLTMPEHTAAQHHALPLNGGLSEHIKKNVPRKEVLPIMLGQGIVQHYDMPLSGGLTIPCHRMWSY